MVSLPSADFLSKSTFSNHSFRNTIRVSNILHPDKDRLSVGPDLGPIVCKAYQQSTKFPASMQIFKLNTCMHILLAGLEASIFAWTFIYFSTVCA